MANRLYITASKTYKTEASAEKAMTKTYGYAKDLRYTVLKNEAGRYFVLFLGTEGLKHGVHFNGHCIAS